MNATITMSSKYQFVMPKKIREELKLVPGEKVHLELKDGEVIMKKQDPVEALVGMLKPYADGIDPAIRIRKMRDEEWD